MKLSFCKCPPSVTAMARAAQTQMLECPWSVVTAGHPSAAILLCKVWCILFLSKRDAHLYLYLMDHMSTWYSQVEGKKFITWKLSQGGIAWAWSHLFSLIFVWAFIVWNSYTAPPPKFSKGSLQPVSLVTESEVQESERCLTIAPW